MSICKCENCGKELPNKDWSSLRDDGWMIQSETADHVDAYHQQAVVKSGQKWHCANCGCPDTHKGCDGKYCYYTPLVHPEREFSDGFPYCSLCTYECEDCGAFHETKSRCSKCGGRVI